ncbi:beta-galactosidase 11-like [Malania oleifera]|uniref:beta-galactosidase 11-like n=1 Tax=Malania oleifera TaxID=397392 RepID=UPI0025ADD92A|nr:beta-galactosidase 11-like [Malania oleifera]
MAASSHAILLSFIFLQLASSVLSHDGMAKKTVTYDGRSLMVDGRRELLFSGSIHYPRSTPEMWPDLLKKAKQGGLNVIQTYVFWNLHEPVQGQFNFEGNNDLVKFIRLIGEHDMYVTLRVGPFIEAEWNHGGFPYWLREVKNITFRADNEPFKYHMKKFTKMIIQKMKDEKLFAPQGGPIILAQIENEYNNIQLAYKELGTRYVQWAGNMAVGLKTGVPWIMCKQKDAPGPVINTCNGRHCGDTFTGPNHPSKPSLWTENWTAQYRVFGDPPSQRAAEDLAFSVARFFSKNGTLTNYYMYHGGTNFGRTGSSFVTTRYYDEAPLDEFGLQREPKYGHLRDLHAALRLCRKPLLWGTPGTEFLGLGLEARFYEKPGSTVCAAFLTNNNSRTPATVTFRGQQYFLPPHSISILPDCKTVVYNTQKIVAQHSARNFKRSKLANKNLKWEMSQESIPTTNEVPVNSNTPIELYGLTKDTSDYAWYTTSIDLHIRDLPMRRDIKPVLRVASLGHAMLAFVNDEFVGCGHGNNIEKSFVLQKPVNLRPGTNHIALLAMTVGFPDSGAYMEHRYAGPRAISILGLNTGTLDLTLNGWGHQVGLSGEKVRAYTQKGSHRVKWTGASATATANGTGPAVTWYKTYFDTPEGDNPVAVRLSSMGKGMAWVNGKSIGRYWVSHLSPLGNPTQSEYHIPRSFLKPTDNLLVIFEESGGKPEEIEIQLVNRDTICSVVSETHPPRVSSWEKKENELRAVVDAKSKAHLKCPDEKVIVEVEFASFGDPYGSCGDFIAGNCSSSNAKSIVTKHCLGKCGCDVPLDAGIFSKGGDVCLNMLKTLAIQVRCGREKHLRNSD